MHLRDDSAELAEEEAVDEDVDGAERLWMGVLVTGIIIGVVVMTGTPGSGLG